ncbi:MAG: hypothetical protein ABI692_13240 [Terracoccus sp.]
MTSHLVALGIDEDDHDTPPLRRTDDTGFPIRSLPSKEQKTGPNQMHFDLTSRSMKGQREIVARAAPSSSGGGPPLHS